RPRAVTGSARTRRPPTPDCARTDTTTGEETRPMDHDTTARRLTDLLGPGATAVAVAFRVAAPAGVARVERPGPAGCAYWKLAAEGEVFYTEAADHYNCPVGAHTHGVDLPAARAAELEAVVGTMVGLEYLRMEEVPALPRVAEPFRVAVYAPLAKAP